MRRHILPFLLAGCTATAGMAQNDLFMLSYPVAFPTGNLQDYIEKTCFRGIGFGYRHMESDEVAYGLDISSHMFYERKDKATYSFENTSITGVQYRYNYFLPVSAQVDYVLGAGKDMRPFLGMGVGALYLRRTTDFGIYEFFQDDWQFMIKPEVGISYYMNQGTGLLISASYLSGFDTKELEGQSFLTVNVGLIWGN